jgi:hypothetical protein
MAQRLTAIAGMSARLKRHGAAAFRDILDELGIDGQSLDLAATRIVCAMRLASGRTDVTAVADKHGRSR